MACTTLLVGKNASYDGSTIVARNEDSGSTQFNPKRFVVVKPEDQPREYHSVISHLTIELPDNPLRYTSVPNAILDEGVWAEAGVNSKNVSMSATETLTTNERVLGADPFVEYAPAKGNPGEEGFEPEHLGGIGEEDLVTIVLPYISTAREGVERLGALLEQFGTYEMNGIAFSDVNEIWWLETVGGHHWIARRVPDDAYVTMPNQLGIDSFDLDDALGQQRNFMCSADLREFINNNHLDLSLSGDLNPRDAFGSHSDSDHVYNTPRAWVMQRFFNAHSNVWDGPDADYRPDDDDIPWSRVPERKITIEDVKYVLSLHYQGTAYDPYGHVGRADLRNAFRPIGINRQSQLSIVQIRPYEPEANRTVQWLTMGSNVFNTVAPYYANVNTTPAYLENTTARVTSENYYWENRIIAALADAHFQETKAHIERYQEKVPARGYEVLHATDAAVRAGELAVADSADEQNGGAATGQDTAATAQGVAGTPLAYDEATPLLEAANQKVADLLKVETDDLLNKVLYEASLKMNNGFSRDDA